MSDIALRVEGLGKQYRLAPVGARVHYKTLQEELLSLPRRLWAGGRKRAQAGEPFWALKDVTFELAEGEVLGIIGRNGAGKSTLLKILSRITQPTRGRAEIYGRVGSLLEVGTGFHNELTGRENIYLSGAVLGMTRAEVRRRFDEIVAFAGVERFLDTPVKHYSSGMYMRLAFAVAAHLDPEILVIDEVLAVGDAEFQKKCLGKMSQVASAGRTVLFVSHNLNAVETLCGSAMLLEAGQVRLWDRNVRAVLQQYQYGDGDGCRLGQWVNSGDEHANPWFKPLRFHIADGQGRLQAMPVTNSADFYVHLEAEIAEYDPALTVGYAIYAEGGELLYWSYQTDTSEHAWPQLRPGICRLRSQIPRRFLNEGTYRLELLASLHFRKWLLEPLVSAPRITLTIQGGLSDSPYWMQWRPGLLAPVLPWTAVDRAG
jgi:lipopolysaccharide transport system ATP-binding protein